MDKKILMNLKCTMLVMLLMMSSLVIVTGSTVVSAISNADFEYQYTNGDTQVEITNYIGAGGSVNIPGQIDGKPVTSIAVSAFSSKSTITSIYIPSEVLSIGMYAFYYCTSLSSIEVNSSNPNYASVDGVLYIKNITTIIQCPNAKVGALVLPDTVTTIGSNALYHCDFLTSISIPSGMVYLESYMFNGCSSLTNIKVNASNTKFSSVNGVLYDKNVSKAIKCPNAKVGALIIPNTVTSIEDNAFSSCASLTSVTMANGIETIGYSAFSSCSSLNTISLPGNLTSIDNYAFAYCTSLNSISFPEKLVSIGERGFYGCSALTSVVIPRNVTSIGVSAFQSCSTLIAFNVNASNPSFSSVDDILYDKANTTLIQCPSGKMGAVIIPGTVTTILDDAFYSCTSIISVTIPSGVTSIGNYSFYYCESMIEINIPSGVKTIYDSAFDSCSSLVSITIPNSVVSIGNSSFNYCSSIMTVTIPGSVTYIGDSAFGDCEALTTINVAASNPNYASIDGVLYNKTVTALIQCPSGKIGGVTIPNTVTSINDNAFSYCSALTSVTIPVGVTYIGDSAFYSCDSLSSVTIPTSTLTIGSHAFDYCRSLRIIDVPSGVISIGEYAFADCGYLTAINVAASNVAYASFDGVLYDKAITMLIQCPGAKTGGLTVPNGVTSIGASAFASCTALKSVTLPTGLTTIEASAFSYCSSLTSINMPDTLTAIGSYAFYGCSALTSVTIPSAVTTIGDSAFSYCSALTAINVNASNLNYASVDGVLYDKTKSTLIQCPTGKAGVLDIPDTVTSIGQSAFYQCTLITSVKIPTNVTVIRGNAFYGCSALTSVTIPSAVTTIGDSAFSYCSALTAINVNASNLNYASFNGVLYNKALTTVILCPAGKAGTVTIPTTVTSIGKNAFSQCSRLTSVIMSEGIQTIGGSAFYYCTGLTSIEIPSTVTSIGSYAFYGCSSLTSVTIPANAQSIGNSAFQSCTSLRSVVIPNSVTRIGVSAFMYCSSLTSFNVGASNQNYASVDGVLYNKAMTMLIQYPAGKTGNFIIPSTVIFISNNAFYYCSGLTSVTIPEGVTSISKYVFIGCSALTSVTIPTTVTNIGTYAFESCSSLTSVSIPVGVINIGAYAFYYCESITSMTIPDSVITIGEYAFYGCYDLGSIYIPASVLYIGDSAFASCSAMTDINVSASNPNFASVDGVLYDKAMTTLIQCPANRTGTVTVPASVTTIGNNAFRSCYGVTSTNIPNGVKYIGDYAYEYCSSIPSLVIPDGTISIGSSAFYGCSELTSMTIPSSVLSIGDSAFADCSAMTDINVSASNPNFASVDGVLYDKAMTTLIQCPAGKTGTVTIPGTVNNIGESGFYYCNKLTTVTIPASVSSIGNYAFEYCTALNSIGFPDGLTSIGYYAFYGCTGLRSVTIPNGTAWIADSAFTSCSELTEINVGASNPNFASVDGVFYNKALTTLIQYPANRTGTFVIPSSVTKIGYMAFSSCDTLTSITIPGNVKTIGNYAFYYCSALESLTLSEGIVSIGSYAFYGCSKLSSMTIPATVTSIGSEAASNCRSLTSINVGASNANFASLEGVLYNKALTTLVQCPAGKAGAFAIPESVTNIGNSAFYSCNLTSVIIPSSVGSISGRAFQSCGSLVYMQFGGNAPTCGDQWIDDRNTSLRIYFVSGSSGFTTPTWYGVETAALVPVTGKIVDSSGKGLSNVTVSLEVGSSAKTDANGNFIILASPGNHTVTINGSGIDTKKMDVNVSSSGAALGSITVGKAGDMTLILVLILVVVIVVVLVVVFLFMRKRGKKMTGATGGIPPGGQAGPQMTQGGQYPGSENIPPNVPPAQEYQAPAQQQVQEVSRKCPQCGAETLNAPFCGNCGGKLG